MTRRANNCAGFPTSASFLFFMPSVSPVYRAESVSIRLNNRPWDFFYCTFLVAAFPLCFPGTGLLGPRFGRTFQGAASVAGSRLFSQHLSDAEPAVSIFLAPRKVIYLSFWLHLKVSSYPLRAGSYVVIFLLQTLPSVLCSALRGSWGRAHDVSLCGADPVRSTWDGLQVASCPVGTARPASFTWTVGLAPLSVFSELLVQPSCIRRKPPMWHLPFRSSSCLTLQGAPPQCAAPAAGVPALRRPSSKLPHAYNSLFPP